MPYIVRPCQKIRGVLSLAGDKSISHRAIIISSIAKGGTLIKNFSLSDDCKATLEAFESLGVKIEKKDKDTLIVHGLGFNGFKKPNRTINLGESATSLRILLGLVCAQNFKTKLDGKKSLRRRPMLRVIQPLRLMGAKIKARTIGKDEYPPILVLPSSLGAINYKMNIASAQVKSAIILAGLYAKGITKIYEPLQSRDHTERMLRYFGLDIATKGKWIIVRPSKLTSPKTIHIPSDISSASFFIVLACLLKNSSIRITDLCLNPTRCGLIEVLRRMGAKIKIIYKHKGYFEPIGDVWVKSSRLKAVAVNERQIPKLIDELPILMVAASLAEGQSIFEGAGELRVKETDRIKSMQENLKKMGVRIETKLKENKEVILIRGVERLRGASIKSFGDHRTAMSMTVAALCADSPSRIDDVNCVSKSFPEFFQILKHLIVL